MTTYLSFSINAGLSFTIGSGSDAGTPSIPDSFTSGSIGFFDSQPEHNHSVPHLRIESSSPFTGKIKRYVRTALAAGTPPEPAEIWGASYVPTLSPGAVDAYADWGDPIGAPPPRLDPRLIGPPDADASFASLRCLCRS